MIIYIVTEGEYSDYGIEGVYTKKELAEEAVAGCPNSEIEEWEADIIVPHPVGRHLWSVVMLPGRKVDSCTRMNDGDKRRCTDGEPWRRSDRSIKFIHWATDEKHAIKIASEKLTVLMALDRWPEKKKEEGA